MNSNSWYDTYYNKLQNIKHDLDKEKLNSFLNKFSVNNKNIDKNIENKVNNIEKEYYTNLEEVKNICAQKDFIDLFKVKPCLTIIQKELEIIKLLTKYILQNNNLDYNFFLSCITVLYNLSEILRNKLNQQEIIHEKHNNNLDNIIRCSYKFCSYKDNCNYNYNNKLSIVCYQDHYVHNMVSADLLVLINYIKYKYPLDENNNQLVVNDTIIIHNKEILKTINTLSFVIGHMESELKNKCLYLPENEWDSCHFVKNK
jgi:hypothetical protein